MHAIEQLKLLIELQKLERRPCAEADLLRLAVVDVALVLCRPPHPDPLLATAKRPRLRRNGVAACLPAAVHTCADSVDLL